MPSLIQGKHRVAVGREPVSKVDVSPAVLKEAVDKCQNSLFSSFGTPALVV